MGRSWLLAAQGPVLVTLLMTDLEAAKVIQLDSIPIIQYQVGDRVVQA